MGESELMEVHQIYDAPNGHAVIIGDSRTEIAGLRSQSVQSVITSPPYWGQRNYGHDGQIGKNEPFAQYVTDLAGIFTSIKRVLRPNGVVWLNLGDIYNSSPSNVQGETVQRPGYNEAWHSLGRQKREIDGIKRKELVGLPWAVAAGMMADGWRLERDYIWHKPNTMPQSMTDRPTVATEHVFLFSLCARPFVQEIGNGGVLDVNTISYPGAHFATFPPNLIRPMLMASTRTGDIVLDPFAGAGTTAMVAIENHRRFIGIDIDPENLALINDRVNSTQLSLFI